MTFRSDSGTGSGWSRTRSCWTAAAVLMALPVFGQTPEVSGPTDQMQLEAFVDGVMAVTMEEHRVPGATVSVVKDGEVFFAKGYGYADLESGKPVDPAKTLFRIASISKLFTWTAVMQLVEAGKLDLDRDVNEYLTNVEVPATFEEPITLRHILTHTPGFEDQVIRLFSLTEDALKPLDEVLRDELPLRVRPPGVLPSYSNHATALAGLIVQEVSGIPWELYIEQNILDPLAMRHTTVRQPVPETLAADLSKGYAYEGGRYVEKSFEFVPAAPAGCMSASAVDLAHFMIAHLQDGQFKDTRILKAGTAQRMHAQLFTINPNLPGMLHGFVETPENGVNVYGHGGDTIWFHSMLALMPEHNLGFFVSFNSENGGAARNAFVNAFFDHYFPLPFEKPTEPPASFAGQAKRYEGTYSSIRMSYASPAKLARFLGMGTVTVNADSEGYLLVRGLDDQPIRMIPAGDGEFREAAGSRHVYFVRDEAGKVTHLAVGWIPVLAFERLEGMASPGVQQIIAGLCILIFAAALVLWPGVWAWRRWRARSGGATPGFGIARLAAWLMAALFIVFLVAFASALGDPMDIVFGMPDAVAMALWIPLAALPLVVLCALFTVIVWFRRTWPLHSRIGYTAVALAGVVFLWWLNYWNLLGHHYPGA
jgi:CubicO group peptidase (beta-lactamase class C family)